MRLPLPAPRPSKITRSSPSGRPSRSPCKLYGTPITQRAPARLGWTRDSVTVPITSAMRMAVQLPEDTGHTRWARDLARQAQGAEDLPNLEKRPPRHLHDQQVGAERQRRPG